LVGWLGTGRQLVWPAGAAIVICVLLSVVPVVSMLPGTRPNRLRSFPRAAQSAGLPGWRAQRTPSSAPPLPAWRRRTAGAVSREGVGGALSECWVESRAWAASRATRATSLVPGAAHGTACSSSSRGHVPKRHHWQASAGGSCSVACTNASRCSAPGPRPHPSLPALLSLHGSCSAHHANLLGLPVLALHPPQDAVPVRPAGVWGGVQGRVRNRC